ncbi:hypothetical protein BYT27DRAFT_6529201 [Phlegmacium glaucopus]|nr:hypothetical protein BYT27DRAFT_6529201 [Phlegmacium glaucopus]
MDVLDGNTLENATSINQPPATNPRLEKTSNCPRLNHDIDEDRHKIHKIYHFHNCGTVYMDSLNSHSVTMDNCANNIVRRVTYHHPKITDRESNSDEIIYSQSHAAFSGILTDSSRTRRTYILSFSVDYIVMFSWASLAVVCLAFFIMNLPWVSSCGTGERM